MVLADLPLENGHRGNRLAVEISDEFGQTSGTWHELGALHGMDAFPGAEYLKSGKLYLKEA